MRNLRMPRLGLGAQIFLGLLVGIFIGLFFGDHCHALDPVAMAFIKIWQITIIPMVILSLITGIGRLKQSEAKNVALKTGFVLLAFWAIGLITFFAMQLSFPDIESASFYSCNVSQSGSMDLGDIFIPSNLFRDLSEGTLPAIVLFSVLLGIGLIGDGGSEPFIAQLSIVQAALDRINELILKTIPLGILTITAKAFGTLSLQSLAVLEVFIVSMVAISLIFILVVLPLMITALTDFRYREILRASSRSVIFGFSTSNDFLSLPLIEKGVEGLFSSKAAVNKIHSYSEIIVPISFAFPLMGEFVAILFVLFTAWFYGSSLNPSQQLKLAVIGIPSLCGGTGSYLSVQFLLSTMGLPSDAFDLYVTLGVFRSSVTTALACMSIFSFTVLSMAMVLGLTRVQPKKLLFSLAFIICIFAICITGLKLGFAHTVPGIYHGGEIISAMDLPDTVDGRRLTDLVETHVYLNLSELTSDLDATRGPDIHPGRRVESIKDQNMLRVGYNANCIPFCFFNKNGALIGYDVEMAYDFARFLGVSRIEFIPVTPEKIGDVLSRGYCDVVMSSITVNSYRLDLMKFSDPYMVTHMAFVVEGTKRDLFTDLRSIQKVAGLKVAALDRSDLFYYAPVLLPNATIIGVDSPEEFFENHTADAILTTAEEGSAMTLLHPFYSVVQIEPDLVSDHQIIYAYPVSTHGDDLLMHLNYWLKMEKESGSLQKKYDYWIEGKNVEEKEPRWSVLNDVLHWSG